MAEAAGLTNEASPLPAGPREGEGKSCLAYGFHYVENDGRGLKDYRFSRRSFGFIEDQPLREVALLIYAEHETTLSVSVDGVLVDVRTTTLGGLLVQVRPPLPAVKGATHVLFTLGCTKCAEGDWRKRGVRLLGLTVTTDREVVRYGPAAFTYNAPKNSWLRSRRHFESNPSGPRMNACNAKLNGKSSKSNARR